MFVNLRDTILLSRQVARKGKLSAQNGHRSSALLKGARCGPLNRARALTTKLKTKMSRSPRLQHVKEGLIGTRNVRLISPHSNLTEEVTLQIEF